MPDKNEIALLGQLGPEAPARLEAQGLLGIVENYVNYYASGEGHTARAKRYDLNHFLEFLAGFSGKAVPELLVAHWTLQATKDFVDARLARGEAPATVSRRLATIKHFGRTLAERIPGFVNPAREAKGPKFDQNKPQGLTAEEIEALKQAAWNIRAADRSFVGLRNSLLLELLLATGIRADEARLLVLGQISEDFEWLVNVKTKGKKFRNVYIGSEVRPLIEEYLESRQQEIQGKTGELAAKTIPVFLSTRGSSPADASSFALAPKTVWRIISDFAKVIPVGAKGLPTKLHPHKLRHTFAHGLLESSSDVRLVAQALGHSDVRTTMRYTERGDEEIAKAIEKKIAGKH